MYEVPIKWVFRGNRTTAATHKRRGEALMRMLEHQMSFRDLRQGVLRRFVRPDVLIECDKRFGLRTVTITALPMPVLPVPVPEEMIGFLVAVSDSTGIHLHYAETWDDDFKYKTPMYGHYHPFPDDYNFNNPYRWEGNYWTYWGNAQETDDNLQSRPVTTNLDGNGMDRFRGPEYYLLNYGLVLYENIKGSLDYYNKSRSPTGCKWARPVLMPWNGEKIIQAFATHYGEENISSDDAMRLADIGLGRYNAKGQRFSRYVRQTRGPFIRARTYNADGENYSDFQRHYDCNEIIMPLPTHNGVRRYVTIENEEVQHHGLISTENMLCNIISIRKGKNDVRLVKFKAEYIAHLLPEWLRPYLSSETAAANYMRTIGSWAHVNEETGEIIIHKVLFFGMKYGGDYFVDARQGFVGESEQPRRWGMCSFRIIIPAPIYDMSEADEEQMIVQNARIENMVTREQFLPLFDWLLQKNLGNVYISKVYRSEYTLQDLMPDPVYPPRVLYCYYEVEDVDGNTEYIPDYVDYSFGKVTSRGVTGTPYDIDDSENTKIERDNELNIGLYLFARAYIPDQKTLFALGDTAYSWTRYFGGVAVTPRGMFPQDMVWPAIITTDTRTRPDVTYAGNGLWCCVCERMGEQVMSVHLGAPITTEQRDAGWEEITLVTPEWAATEGNRIVYVRPLLVTEERVVLLAIVREMDAGAAHHYVATCDGPPKDADRTLLKFRGEILLKREDEAMSWDICVLNSLDEYAQMMLRYPTPPIADKAHCFNKTNVLPRLAMSPTDY